MFVINCKENILVSSNGIFHRNTAQEQYKPEREMGEGRRERGGHKAVEAVEGHNIMGCYITACDIQGKRPNLYIPSLCA